MLTFGPVPSRRLGQSLGINHIPPKTCTYACVYCQVGRTRKMTATRQPFYSMETVRQALAEKLRLLEKSGTAIDYLTLVPDGEPALDIHLGELIKMAGRLGPKVAVISNASLIDSEAVRAELAKADWVSLKVDAVENGLWKKIDRPHGSLRLDRILAGIKRFSRDYGGTLVTETMLVKQLNDQPPTLTAVADFLAQVSPRVAYISVPTRPPWESWVRLPDEAQLHLAYQLFSQKLDKVEYLIGYEGNAFTRTGEAGKDILDITAVHPMREDAVRAFLQKAEADPSLLDQLMAEGHLTEAQYGGHRFYLRRFSRPLER